MDMERREFLKKAFKVGGIAALYTLGGSKLVDECLADNVFISGHTGTDSTSGTSWATWSEIHEAGWGDSSNVIVMIPSNTNDAGHEESQGGGLSDANSLFTQAGDLKGATGTGTKLDPYKREFEGGNEKLGVEIACANHITGSNEWCVISKWKDWNITNANEQPMDWANVGNTQQLSVTSNLVGTEVEFIVKEGNANKLSLSTDDMPDTTGYVWVVVGCDGTNTRGGFVDGGSPNGAVKPTSWSADFNDPTDIVTAVAVANMDAGQFGAFRDFSGDGGGNWEMTADLVYIVLANKWLLGA